ncbi:PREDICTED: uncharacterized protein LOC105456632 [Wasmannia auropunctata]|uniref:uncharacterized protein LOC105456632 n=1 Tax=Wasmannia auropunctata TaxID=64793 RepID=UPI0005EF6A65|nr:PREDICTED: uncharacterized protein LOC105456632 [Wasmannia auropunctata]
MYEESMNYYVPIPEDKSCERPTSSHTMRPRYTPRILGRRFALTSTAFKYLDIGITVGPVSSVELLIGDNRGNQIVLPYATWKAFIERRADIEQLLQSAEISSLKVHDLIVQLVKMYESNTFGQCKKHHSPNKKFYIPRLGGT